MYAIMDNLSELKMEQTEQAKMIKAQDDKLTEIEQRQEDFRDAFKPSDTLSFQDWARRSIAKCADSERFTKGDTRSEKFALATLESYERLNNKRRCRLDYRLQNAQANAMRNGASQSKAGNITKMQVICSDKDLRVAYEGVIKEMMLYYVAK